MTRKPKIFLISQLSQADWRHDIVPGLRHHTWGSQNIETEDFEFAGPYLPSYDKSPLPFPWHHPTAAEVRDRNMQALTECDLAVAYITTPDAHESMAQINQLIAAGIPFALMLSANLHVYEMWYWRRAPLAIITNVLPANLLQKLRHAVALYTRRSEEKIK